MNGFASCSSISASALASSLTQTGHRRTADHGGAVGVPEHLGGDLTITLLEACGIGVEVHEIDDALMAEGIAWLEAREAA